jgi:hypothetical protein
MTYRRSEFLLYSPANGNANMSGIAEIRIKPWPFISSRNSDGRPLCETSRHAPLKKQKCWHSSASIERCRHYSPSIARCRNYLDQRRSVEIPPRQLRTIQSC